MVEAEEQAGEHDEQFVVAFMPTTRATLFLLPLCFSRVTSFLHSGFYICFSPSSLLHLSCSSSPPQPRITISGPLLHSTLPASTSQGSPSAVNYIIDFHTAAAASDNEPALVDAFYRSLSDRLKDALTAYDRPRGLRPLMDLVTHLEGRFREHQQERHRGSLLARSGAYVVPERCIRNPGAHATGENKINARRTRTSVQAESVFILWRSRTSCIHMSCKRSGLSCYITAKPSSHPTVQAARPVDDILELVKVPPEYHDLKQVFNKTRSSSLPPHRPYDRAIELLPGTVPPRGRLFSLSVPEQRAMTDYITEAQRAGLIRPSSSPTGAGFFFVGKKDGGLDHA
uniref:uncharacterized protein LOC109966579 n=1 Tax=Monopterus albus TaxID=43700 RepID=UPI0009B37F75|nr:uncharacterized protein LOC109966579 [Monopterus albus]